MLRGIGRYVRRHHIALLALFVALGVGTAYALDRNSVKSKHIAPRAVKLSDTNDRLRLKCPGGTRYHEGACIETDARAEANWFGAHFDCVDDGRRLPDPVELLSFRREPGIELESPYEWTFQFDPNSNFKVAIGEDTYANPTESGLVAYRCVAPAKR